MTHTSKPTTIQARKANTLASALKAKLAELGLDADLMDYNLHGEITVRVATEVQARAISVFLEGQGAYAWDHAMLSDGTWRVFAEI